jgi:hypothetical protein
MELFWSPFLEFFLLRRVEEDGLLYWYEPLYHCADIVTDGLKAQWLRIERSARQVERDCVLLFEEMWKGPFDPYLMLSSGLRGRLEWLFRREQLELGIGRGSLRFLAFIGFYAYKLVELVYSEMAIRPLLAHLHDFSDHLLENKMGGGPAQLCMYIERDI